MIDVHPRLAAAWMAASFSEFVALTSAPNSRHSITASE
jgi:hypothetical protein